MCVEGVINYAKVHTTISGGVGKGYANFVIRNLDVTRFLYTYIYTLYSTCKGLVFEIDILYEAKSYLTLTC